MGMFAGSALTLAGLAVLALPLFYAKRALSSAIDFTVRRDLLTRSTESWAISAPMGLLLSLLGLFVLVLSIAVYADTRRKESSTDPQSFPLSK